MTAGGRTRTRNAFIALIIFAACMHGFAYWVVAGYADAGIDSDPTTLIAITTTLLLSWSLLLSQAMESVTRAFYARADLDLILTSPVSARKVFAVRMGRIAAAAVAVAGCWRRRSSTCWHCGGARWLAAFGVVAAMGALATAAALALTIALFRLVGPRRTRLIAQIVAAIIGAAFVIGLQVMAIFSGGTLSRAAALQSEWMLTHAPNMTSLIWWPARAVLGDVAALAAIVLVSIALLGGSIALFSARFGDHAMAAASVGSARVRQRRGSLAFRPRLPQRVLRQKEWTLLLRDPWLISQTLMQILLSAAAGHSVVDHVPQRLGQLCRPDPGHRHGRRATGWRPRLAVDLGRGCARSGRHRADRRDPRGVGQDRGGDRHGRVDICPDHPSAVSRSAVRGFGRRARNSGLGRRCDLYPAVFPGAGAAQPVPPAADLVADRDLAEAFSSIAWAATAAIAAAETRLAIVPWMIAVLILLGVRWISPSRQT